MPECLPSLRTVQRLFHSAYAYHMEGVFEFKGLEHLNLYKAKQVDVLPSKNQALSEYCTHFK